MHQLIAKILPDEIYNLAAQSHVAVSFEMPLYTVNADGTAILGILEAVRLLGLDCKIYQAGTSEMFGNAPAPQNLSTPFMPCSPYACAKVMAHHLMITYRHAYDMHCVNGILFNHESPLTASSLQPFEPWTGSSPINSTKPQPYSLPPLQGSLPIRLSASGIASRRTARERTLPVYYPQCAPTSHRHYRTRTPLQIDGAPSPACAPSVRCYGLRDFPREIANRNATLVGLCDVRRARLCGRSATR